MVSKHFLTLAVLAAAGLVAGADPSLYGGGGGRSGAYGGAGIGGNYGNGTGNYGLGRGYWTGGFYGGGLFYGDYITGGGFPGYFTYPYPAAPYYSYDLPYAAPYTTTPRSSNYYDPAAAGSWGRAGSPVVPPIPAGIRVPLPDPKAKVVFDGHETTSTGSERNYTTPDLTPGPAYYYHLQVSWMQDGRPVTQERTVTVMPGETIEVVFTRSPSEAIPIAPMTK